MDFAKQLELPELPKYLSRVDQKLAQVMRSESPVIDRALKHLLKTNGKRLRPTLVMATAVAGGAKVNQQLVNAAAALELVHLGSLVHDDIIDRAKTRRRSATINALEGKDQAIVVGDYLFAKAFEVANSASPEIGSLVAATITDLCVGESIELADQHNTARSIDSYLLAISKKTAVLIAASCTVGGLCAKLSAAQLKKIAGYGQNFGTAFQIIDDLLDLLSTEEQLGKPAGGDLRAGVYTLPLLLALAGLDKSHAKELIKTKNPDELLDLINKNGYLQQTAIVAKKYNDQAADSLKGFSPAFKSLAVLPKTYFEWSHKLCTNNGYLIS